MPGLVLETTLLSQYYYEPHCQVRQLRQMEVEVLQVVNDGVKI